MDEYKSEEMARHLKTLREVFEWLKANTTYGVSMKSFMDRPYADTIEMTRRRVKFHYFSIHDLYETKYLKKRIYLKAMKNTGLTLFFDVIEPLDYWNSKRTGTPFEEEKYRLIEKTTGYEKRDSQWYREEGSAIVEPSDRTTERLSDRRFKIQKSVVKNIASIATTHSPDLRFYPKVESSSAVLCDSAWEWPTCLPRRLVTAQLKAKTAGPLR